MNNPRVVVAQVNIKSSCKVLLQAVTSANSLICCIIKQPFKKHVSQDLMAIYFTKRFRK